MKFYTFCKILVFISASISITLTAPATPHSLEINPYPFDTVVQTLPTLAPEIPPVTLSDLSDQVKSTIQKIQNALQTAAEKVRQIIAKKSRKLVPKIDAILTDPLAQTNLIVESTLNFIEKDPKRSYKDIELKAESSLESLQEIVGLTSEQIEELIENDAPTLETKIHAQLVRLSLLSEAAAKPLIGMLTANTIVTSVTPTELEELVKLAKSTLEGVKIELELISNQLEPILGWESDVVGDQLQKILEDTETAGKEMVKQFIDNLAEAASQDETKYLVTQIGLDLEALLSQTKVEVKEVTNSIGEGKVKRTEEILVRLGDDVEDRVLPIFDFIATLGSPHIKGYQKKD